MPNTIYERLALNFDTTKFGNVNVLGQSTLNYFNATTQSLKDWQYDDVINSSASSSEYFKNPLSDICDSLKVVVDDLSESSNNVLFTNNPSTGNLIYSTSVSSSSEILAFKSHTNNISGVTAESMTSDIPNYDMSISYGNEVLKYVISEDEGMGGENANASAALGSLTSLFIKEDLEGYLTVLENDVDLVDSSITITTIEDPENPGFFIDQKESNLSSSQITSVYSNVNSFYTLIYTRRTEDWAYFVRMRDTVTDIYRTKKFDFIGNTQISLINDYIGTEKLKSIIANT